MTETCGLQLALLGQAAVRVDGQLLMSGLPAKGLAMLAYLAVTGRPCSRETLAGLLWGDMPEAAARTNLRVTLNRLARELRPYIESDYQTIGLKTQPDAWLDVVVLETAVQQDRAAWQTAVSLYRGDFLDGLTVPDAPAFEEWALLERERLRLLVIDLLHRLAADALERHAYADGIASARRILTLDNWREEAHRLLMRLLAANGQRSEALAQFETCRRLLAEALGVAPSAETAALYEAIKAGQHAPVTASPLERAIPSTHNLPAIATSFVGREQELAQLAGLLAQPDGRLLTILGAGGIGKTRLALETAVRHLGDPRFPDGLFFVPLADASTGSDITPLIAEALELPLSGTTAPEEQLLAYLRGRRLLLMLDNFEHLLPQADLVARLLAGAPGLRLIVTARERLNLYEEWLVEIGGLPLPAAAADDWLDYGAPQLFIQRARRVYLGFDSDAEREAILQICRLVGGVPLALELAAAWVRTVPAREIARSIESSLAVLTSSLRNIPERQRSLRATFEYSWKMLNEEEQCVLGQLAVFRGGFDGDAASSVLGASLRSLSTLVDKSLLQRRPDGRYYLHEIIRLFAREQVTTVEWAPLRAAHSRYYAQVLAAQGAKSDGPEAEDAFRAIALELENGRFAWRWLLEQLPDSEAIPLLAQCLTPLSLFYLRRGRSQEAASWLAGSLEQLATRELEREESVLPLAAQLHHHQAKHEAALGAYRPARERLLACLPDLEAAGVTWSVADAWAILGRVQRHLGELAAAETSFRRSLELHRSGGSPSSVASTLNGLGVLAKNDGRYDEAVAYYTESLEIFRRQGDQSGVAVCLINLGNIANVQGSYEVARDHYQESYQLAEAAENRSQMAINLLNLGSVASAMGDYAAAERWFRGSLALGREIEHRLVVAAALNGLGQALLANGDLAAAREQLRQALETAVSLEAQGMILAVLGAGGRLLVLAGEPEGVVLLHLLMNHASTHHYVKEEVAQFMAEQGIEPLETETADLTLDETVTLALRLL